MTSVWGRAPEIPLEILGRVVGYARELGRDVASDDLFLLALCDGEELDPAARALAACGVSSELVLAEIRADGDRDVGEQDGLRFSPAFYTMQGLARGFAAALADSVITPEHVLLAVLWLADGHSDQLLWRLGISRESIVERLRELGAAVPRGPLPVQVEIEWSERVWFDRAQVGDVIDHLGHHIPPGTRWGFNYDGDRAWAHAESSVDLDSLVRAAISAE
jgi:hypothetical protein